MYDITAILCMTQEVQSMIERRNVKKKLRYEKTESGYKTHVVNVRLDEKAYQKLEIISERKKIDKSKVIRELIEKAK